MTEENTTKTVIKSTGNMLMDFVTVTQLGMAKEQQSIADMLSNSTKKDAEEIFQDLHDAIDMIEECINHNNDVCMMSGRKAHAIMYAITDTFPIIKRIVGDLTHKYNFDKEMAEQQANTNIEAVKTFSKVQKVLIENNISLETDEDIKTE